MKKYSNRPNGGIIVVFGMSSAATLGVVDGELLADHAAVRNALNEGIKFQNNKITFEIALKEHLFSNLIQP